MTREEAIQRFNGIINAMSISIAQSKFYPSKAELDELCDMAIEALKDRPKGEWKYYEENKLDGECCYECSECGRMYDYKMNYCGYCGAKMDIKRSFSENKDAPYNKWYSHLYEERGNNEAD